MQQKPKQGLLKVRDDSVQVQYVLWLIRITYMQVYEVGLGTVYSQILPPD